jgi:uncharacterized membrane protein YhaH (DUF805 family)
MHEIAGLDFTGPERRPCDIPQAKRRGRMFLQGLFWSQLKKVLVREGRSSRQNFVLSGALPFFLSVFGILCAPAFPAVGEFGFVLLIAALFTSRALLAQAIRRTHDLGVSDEYLSSLKHQTQAYLQVFVVLMIATTFQQINTGSPATALIVAAIGAAAMTCIMVGGTKPLWTLATTIGEFGPNAQGLPTEGPLQPVTQAIRSQPSRPLQTLSPPAPPREPRKTVAVPPGRQSPMVERVSGPAPQQPPRIRKRSKVIGEW